MSALSQLLDRLRRVRPPPGAAARIVAVPSTGDELSGEVTFLFGELDEIAERGGRILSAARSEAAEIEASAAQQRLKLLEEARADSDRLAAQLLAERRASCERRARRMLTDAEREAARVLARGRERTPALVGHVVARLLEGGP